MLTCRNFDRSSTPSLLSLQTNTHTHSDYTHTYCSAAEYMDACQCAVFMYLEMLLITSVWCNGALRSGLVVYLGA